MLTYPHSVPLLNDVCEGFLRRTYIVLSLHSPRFPCKPDPCSGACNLQRRLYATFSSDYNSLIRQRPLTLGQSANDAIRSRLPTVQLIGRMSVGENLDTYGYGHTRSTEQQQSCYYEQNVSWLLSA